MLEALQNIVRGSSALRCNDNRPVVHVLHRDYETRSTLELQNVGPWKYASGDYTDVWCCAYAVDNQPMKLWVPGDPVPPEFIQAAADPNWLLCAHNAQFELAIEHLIMERRYGWPKTSLRQQICTMSFALASALPGALDSVSKALGLPYQKDREGYLLMKQMSRPRRARKGEDPNAIHWVDSLELRQRLHRYCMRDGETERALFHRLPPLSETEHEHWQLDAIINERGFYVDCELAMADRDIARPELASINAKIAALSNGEITSASGQTD